MSTRIAVIGISGSGKTRLARALALKADLPVTHMDALFWRGRWEPVPEADYLAEHARLIAGERWIIEGFIDPTMAERLHRADRVIFLDLPGWVCAWRVVKRWLAHRRVARAELPSDARERLGRAFLQTVVARAERPAILAALRDVDPAKVVVVASARSPILEPR